MKRIMTRRRYPKFFDQVPSLAMVEHEQKLEHDKFMKKYDVKAKKTVKKTEFISCEKCELYDPTPDGKFGCKRKGKCIHL